MFSIILCSFCSQSPAAQTSEQGSGRDTLRLISANRSLLARYEADYDRVRSELIKEPSPKLSRELESAELKVRALNEDFLKLLDQLPQETQTDELVKYVLARENAKKKAAMEAAFEELSTRSREVRLEAQKYYESHEQALELVSQDRYEEAIRIYEDILLIKPDDDQAYMILGHLCVMTGQFTRAEKAFFSAVEVDPANARDIAPFYQDQIVKNPNDDSAYTQLGYVYLMFRNLRGASEAFEDALSVNSDNPQARAGLELVAGLNQQNL